MKKKYYNINFLIKIIILFFIIIAILLLYKEGLRNILSRVLNIDTFNDYTTPIKKSTIAILVPTYQRKNGKTPEIIKKMVTMLSKQIYTGDITLFIIGDCYENNEEFESICNEAKQSLSHKMNVVHYNCDIHFRDDYFKINKNKWSMGGINAVTQGLQRIYDGGYDYYFHLDDDDYWYPEYINYVMDSLHKFPETAFCICKAYYKDYELPRQNITELYYNNYKLVNSDSVHASWCINMKLIGKEFLEFNKNMLNAVLELKTNPEKEINYFPGDGQILDHFGKLQEENKIKAICLPQKYVRKDTDVNIP
jgi:hypothetical protein